MCTVCGCAGEGATIEGAKAGGAGHAHPHAHRHDHAHDHAHSHPHAHDGDHAHGHDHGAGEGHVHTHRHAHPHDHGHAHPHGHDHDHDHSHAHGHAHGHDHDHPHAHGAHAHDHGDAAHPHARGVDLHFGAGPAGAHVPGLSQSRLIEIETKVLAKNDALAAGVRGRLAATATLALNLVSSPGSGKTTLLVATIRALAGRFPVGVIEGDQQTARDADRIRETGAPAVQVNTGKGCHLDAAMVGAALDRLPSLRHGVLFVENVGNLVCPAAFDLGEDCKVALASVTEGDDKPLKYPDMFAAARLVLITKTDLAAHCDADPDALEAAARRVNPTVEILRVSARTGEGMDGWIAWIAARRAATLARAAADAEAQAAALRAAAEAAR
jgi:hydrogenase nickel incorporation protein HypB